MRIPAVLTVLVPSLLVAQGGGRASALPVWHLEQVWEVGGDPSGGNAFDFELGFGLLPGGGLVHFNYKEQQLYFLSPSGVPLVTAGRSGSGPGDLKGANGLVVAPNGTVVVNDRSNGRLSRFTPAGKFLDVMPLPGSRNSGGSGWNAMFLKDGRLIEQVDLLGPKAIRSGRETETILWNAALTHPDTLQPERCNPASVADFARTHVPIISAKGDTIQLVPFPYLVPMPHAAIDPAGFYWEGRSLESNEIVRRAIGSCTVTATIRLPGERAEPVASLLKDAKARIETFAQRTRALPPEFSRLPTKVAWYNKIQADAEGNLWVERVRPDEKGLMIEIYDRTGKPVAIMDGTSFGFAAITGDRVYRYRYDTDGIGHLAAMRIVKQ